MTSPGTLQRIVALVQVGDDRMAASDDPLFLGLRGSQGREFRLLHEKGRSLRRGAKDHFVLASPEDPETNVAHPEMNDPSRPAIDVAEISGVYLRKGMEPIPNVRGYGEMDDRLEVVSVEVELHVEGRSEPIFYTRKGPFWLGLICGQWIDLPCADGPA